MSKRATALVFLTVFSVGSAVAEPTLSDYEHCVEKKLNEEIGRFVGKNISEYVNGVVETCRPTLMGYNKSDPVVYPVEELESVEERVRDVLKLEFVRIIVQAYEKGRN